MKWSKFYKVTVSLAILLYFSTSCTREDPNLSDYKGTWSAVEPISIPGQMSPYWHIITFTESTFFDALQIQVLKENLPEDELRQEVWTDKLSAKGSISFNGNVITRIISEIGIYSFSQETGPLTGDWKIYKEDNEEFNLLMLMWELTKITESQFSIVGNHLTLRTDLNGDGDYADEYEEIVYKKDTRPVRY